MRQRRLDFPVMNRTSSGVLLLIGLCLASLSACEGGRVPAVFLGGSPPLETPLAQLDAAIDCRGFHHPDQEPVLLIHGTGTYGAEQWDWNYRPWLEGMGFDVCTVTYPDRGLGDQQIAAEYVVHAVRQISAASGQKVGLIGHSQGASMPRWAIKWWPDIQPLIDDFVQLAAPNQGTLLGSPAGVLPLPMPAALFQFAPDSQFVMALNRGDETPGDIDYSSIYTLFDELVQPQFPASVSELEAGQNNPRVANILLQDVCPGRLVDHVTIGLTDSLAATLALDALRHPGPADPTRAGGSALCLGLTIVAPDTAIPAFFEFGPGSITGLPPGFHSVSEEPPLKPYAQES